MNKLIILLNPGRFETFVKVAKKKKKIEQVDGRHHHYHEYLKGSTTTPTGCKTITRISRDFFFGFCPTFTNNSSSLLLFIDILRQKKKKIIDRVIIDFSKYRKSIAVDSRNRFRTSGFQG